MSGRLTDQLDMTYIVLTGCKTTTQTQPRFSFIFSFLWQVKEGECIQPMSGPGYNTYPCIYRSQIYFLSSTQARDEFIQDPIKYVSQPTPKPVVPIRIAVLGPPKSGKTTCKYY